LESHIPTRNIPNAETVPSSEDLFSRVRGGDSNAFAALYERHASFAMSVALGTTGDRWAAEDAVQEAFLSPWRSAHLYDPARSSLTAWIRMIVRRRAIEQLRRRRLTNELPDDDGLPAGLLVHDAWNEVAGKLDRIELVRAIARLSATQRKAVELAFFAEMTHVEVADRLGMPLGTAKSRIRAGLRALRAAIPVDSAALADGRLPQVVPSHPAHASEGDQTWSSPSPQPS